MTGTRLISGKGYAWSVEDDRLIIELWQSGSTATEIQRRLPSRTRNAIIGRVHRLGIERTMPHKLPAKRQKKTPMPRPPHIIPAPAIAPEPIPAEPLLFPIEEGGITIMELKRGLCADVLDLHGAPNGLALYCGKKTVGKNSFCPKHMSIYYTPYSARRRVG